MDARNMGNAQHGPFSPFQSRQKRPHEADRYGGIGGGMIEAWHELTGISNMSADTTGLRG